MRTDLSTGTTWSFYSRQAILLATACLLSASAMAQTPSITAVLDGAGNTPGVPQGAVFIIKGTGLSPAGFQQAPAPNYPIQLNNVSISFTPVAGGSSITALMVYTYNLDNINQLAGVLQSTVAAGSYNVRVMNGTQTSAPFVASVMARKPSIVSADGSGTGPAQATITGGLILQRFANVGKIAQFDTRPIRPGERVDLWGTGGGADVASDTGGSSGDQTAAANARVILNGTIEVTPLYFGRSSGFPGLDQTVFLMPQNIVLSCFVRVQIRAGGVLGNAVTLATSNSDACSHPGITQQQLQRLSSGGTLTVGSFNITSASILIPGINIGGFVVPPQTVLLEDIAGSFAAYGGAFGDQLIGVGATPGTCYAYRQTGSIGELLGEPTVLSLDAGPFLTVNRPGGANATLNKVDGSYSVEFESNPLNPVRVLTAGTYRLSGTGGAQVGAFSAETNFPAFTWTGMDSISAINRSQGVTVNWTGGGTGLVAIYGFSGNAPSGGFDAIFDAGTFYCIAQASAGTFTVPANILQQLPTSTFDALAADAGGAFEMGMLTVAAVGDAQQGTFTAPLVAGGTIDFGLFTYTNGAAKILNYQ